MRAKTCGMSDEQKLRRRLHYCGTCKTIGSLYGQKARLLLNHDTVFLAEILTALGGETVENWQKAYQSFNCLNLPAGAMPQALEFAATANVVLAEFKIKDHRADERKMRWRVAGKTFSESFARAARKLDGWNFPLREVRELLSEQSARERAADATLETLAAPTAQTTRLFFAYGARVAGRSDLENEMSALGAAFGRLVYLLDAFEDYEKDWRTNQFNAFRRVFASASGSRLTGETRRAAVAELRTAQSEISKNLQKLPLADEFKNLFIARLESNLSRKLKTDLPVLAARRKVCAPKKHLTFAERRRNAWETARGLTAGEFKTWLTSWQFLPAFGVVAVVAFIAPQEAARAKSWDECAGLGLNLMFLGSLAAAIVAAGAKMAMPPNIAEKVAQEVEKKQKQGWCDRCCADCGCNDGCCDGCCCACDNCCCDGCCDGCGCDC